MISTGRYVESLETHNRLLMLGVIHRDREGTPLLSAALERIRPDVITVEFSRYGLAFRRRHREALRKRAAESASRVSAAGGRVSQEALEALLSYVDLPHEFEAASDYSVLYNRPLHLVDMDFFSYMKLRDIDKLFDRKNLDTLLSGGDPGRVPQEKALARLFFEKGVRTFPYSEEMSIRDACMRDRIAILMKLYGSATFLHICGWQHLCDPYGLYDRFSPEKVFLYDRPLCV